MKPDYERAALLAMETLITNRITSAPVSSLPILKNIKGVLVLSFAEMSTIAEIARDQLVSMCCGNQDAVTIHLTEGKIKYIVAYNQQLPFFIMQRALARELGHIVLGHDGTRPEDVREAEALGFARNLLCPRPLLKAIEASGVPLTVELFGAITGCYKKCLEGIQQTPGAHIAPEINRLVKNQFADYVKNFIAYADTVKADDHSPAVDFGSYFDNYAE